MSGTGAKLAVAALLVATWGWLLPARAQETGEATEEGWQAPIPERVRDRPRPEESPVINFLKLDWLFDMWKSPAQRRAEFFNAVEGGAKTVRDRARAVLAQAEYLEEAGKYYDAFHAYKRAVGRYANHIPFNDVMRREYELSRDHLEDKKEWALIFRVSTNDKAKEVYEHVYSTAPHGDWAPEALFGYGRVSMKQKNYEDAAETFRRLVTQFPRDDLAPEARLDLARALLYLGREGDNDLELTQQAEREIQLFLKEHPDHARADEARRMMSRVDDVRAGRLLFLGEFYQRVAHWRPDASRRYLDQLLEQYPQSSHVPAARELLERLAHEQAARATEAVAAPPAPTATTPEPGIEPPPEDPTEPATLPAPPATNSDEPAAGDLPEGVSARSFDGADKFLRPLDDLDDLRRATETAR